MYGNYYCVIIYQGSTIDIKIVKMFITFTMGLAALFSFKKQYQISLLDEITDFHWIYSFQVIEFCSNRCITIHVNSQETFSTY